MKGRRIFSDSVMLRPSKRTGLNVAHLSVSGSIWLKRGGFEMMAWNNRPRQRTVFRINHVNMLLNINAYSCFIV
jgi:hypothetical protein